VCLTFISLSAKAAGFNVYAVVDASGSFSPLMTTLAIERMSMNGINLMTWFAVGCELLSDWRNP